MLIFGRFSGLFLEDFGERSKLFLIQFWRIFGRFLEVFLRDFFWYVFFSVGFFSVEYFFLQCSSLKGLLYESDNGVIGQGARLAPRDHRNNEG